MNHPSSVDEADPTVTDQEAVVQAVASEEADDDVRGRAPESPEPAHEPGGQRHDHQPDVQQAGVGEGEEAATAVELEGQASTAVELEEARPLRPVRKRPKPGERRLQILQTLAEM